MYVWVGGWMFVGLSMYIIYKHKCSVQICQNLD